MNRTKKEITIDEDFLKDGLIENSTLTKPMKVIICGINGKMGQVLTSVISSKNDCQIVAGIDRFSDLNSGTSTSSNFQPYNVYSFQDSIASVEADVIIDFSHPDMLDSLLKFGLDKKIPLVICTTGFSEDQTHQIHMAAKQIPIFFSGNMSLGINLLIELSKKTAKVLGDNFDIEIIEKHHNQKIDAPSGTALMIANAISSEKQNLDYVFDRHQKREKRKKNEIGIHSIRGGTIVGEHEVIFAGQNEMISLSHSAQSKEIFALGAIRAAKFVSFSDPGLYFMKDIINECND